jgi:hypothetical protein
MRKILAVPDIRSKQHLPKL